MFEPQLIPGLKAQKRPKNGRKMDLWRGRVFCGLLQGPRDPIHWEMAKNGALAENRTAKLNFLHLFCSFYGFQGDQETLAQRPISSCKILKT